MKNEYPKNRGPFYIFFLVFLIFHCQNLFYHKFKKFNPTQSKVPQNEHETFDTATLFLFQKLADTIFCNRELHSIILYPKVLIT